MNLPITSRIKRSPLLQTETNNIDATGSRVTPGEDKEITKTETVVKGPTEKYEGELATGKKEEEWAKQKAYCDGKPIGTEGCSGFHKSEGGGTEEVTTTKIEPGEDVTIDTKLYKKEKQDVKEPWKYVGLIELLRFRVELKEDLKINQTKYQGNLLKWMTLIK